MAARSSAAGVMFCSAMRAITPCPSRPSRRKRRGRDEDQHPKQRRQIFVSRLPYARCLDRKSQGRRGVYHRDSGAARTGGRRTATVRFRYARKAAWSRLTQAQPKSASSDPTRPPIISTAMGRGMPRFVRLFLHFCLGLFILAVLGRLAQTLSLWLGIPPSTVFMSLGVIAALLGAAWLWLGGN